MELDLKDIVHVPGARLDFDFPLDLSGFPWGGPCPLREPVAVRGSVRNMAGALLLQARLDAVLHLTCDRCTKPFSADKHLEYETLLASELEDEDNDDIVLLDDDRLELDELMTDVFVLGLDTKVLCKEDCRGLCAGCGADLNREPCSCERQVDPRLAGLAKLLGE